MNSSISVVFDVIKRNKFLSEKNFRNKFPDIYDYILTYTSFLTGNVSFPERKYCILNNIKETPSCPMCGKILKFRGADVGYGITCSNKCSVKYTDTHIDILTKKKRYEKSSASIKTSISKRTTEEKKQISDKFKEFHANMSDEAKKKRNQKISMNMKKVIKTYSVEKQKEMILKRLNTMNNKSEEELNNIKLRISKTAKNTMNNKSEEEWEIILDKQHESKRKNNTFNTSKYEDIIYDKLKDCFGVVLRQYKSEEYPFHCDFYIPCIDTYIEYQGMWVHNNHPFDNKNKNDLILLNEWKEKSKKSKFYSIALKVWSISDVQKRQTAIDNKLNWFEFFNIEQFDKWFEQISYKK